MTTTKLPRYLPFFRYGHIGLPFHGLVTNGALTLPTSGTMTYPQPTTGECYMVQGPKHVDPAILETELAELDGYALDPTYAWKDYALLSGSDRQIGVRELGTNGWIYCDDNHSWRVSYDVSTAGTTITISVHLDGAFGTFGVEDIDRVKLAELSFTPKKYDGGAPTTLVNTRTTATHSKTGSVSVVNFANPVCWRLTGTVAPNLTSQLWFDNTNTLIDLGYCYYLTGHGIHTAVQISLAGNGAIAAGSVGDGIVCSISLYRQGDEMVSTYSGSYTAPTGVDGVGPPAGEWESLEIYSGTIAVSYFDVVLPDGSITCLSYSTDYLSTERLLLTKTSVGDTCEVSVVSSYEINIGASFSFGSTSKSHTYRWFKSRESGTTFDDFSCDDLPVYLSVMPDEYAWYMTNGEGWPEEFEYTFDGAAVSGEWGESYIYLEALFGNLIGVYYGANVATCFLASSGGHTANLSGTFVTNRASSTNTTFNPATGDIVQQSGATVCYV